jgi:competence ComEA-like helix-hairpin-helix protein
MRCATKGWGVLGGVLTLALLWPTVPAEAMDPVARLPRPFVAKQRLKPGDPKLDLNQASVEELMRLPGIGRKRAERIVALREKRPFRRIMEIRRVRGLGKKSLKRLLPLITVGKVEKRSARPKPSSKVRAAPPRAPAKPLAAMGGK